MYCEVKAFILAEGEGTEVKGMKEILCGNSLWILKYFTVKSIERMQLGMGTHLSSQHAVGFRQAWSIHRMSTILASAEQRDPVPEQTKKH